MEPIESFARARGPDGKPTVALNVRCLEGVDLAALAPNPFDGTKAVGPLAARRLFATAPAVPCGKQRTIGQTGVLRPLPPGRIRIDLWAPPENGKAPRQLR